VREAFDDFWPVFDEFRGLRGVLHSFTDNAANLQKALERGLYIGVNGIATFASEAQRVIYRTIPQQSLLLETDAPFLTPVPFRGKVCESKHTRVTAEFLSKLRDEDLAQLAQATTHSARHLFQV
jgi:TatD DNase family protein